MGRTFHTRKQLTAVGGLDEISPSKCEYVQPVQISALGHLASGTAVSETGAKAAVPMHLNNGLNILEESLGFDFSHLWILSSRNFMTDRSMGSMS